MKKISFALIAVLAVSFASCRCHSDNVQSSAQIKYDVPKYIEPDWGNFEIQNTQCIQNQWMPIPDGMSQDSFITKLVDEYNACVVWHSVKSNMEMFWRWDCYT